VRVFAGDESDVPEEDDTGEEALELTIAVAEARVKVIGNDAKHRCGTELFQNRELSLFGVVTIIVHGDLVNHFPRDSGANKIERRGLRRSRYSE
jgi:hypothetical protein